MTRSVFPTSSAAFATALAAALLCGCGSGTHVEEHEGGASVAGGAKPLVRAAIEAGAPITEQRGDGLVVEVTERGDGPAIAAGASILLHYDAFLAERPAASGEPVEAGAGDGPEGERAEPTPFDSSRTRGAPLHLRLESGARPRVIEGLRRGVLGLRAGSRATLRIPAHLAWGSAGNAGIGVPPDAAVVFEVHVLSVE